MNKALKTEVNPVVSFEGFFAFCLGVLIIGGPPALMIYFSLWPEYALLVTIVLGFAHIASNISRWSATTNVQILQLENKVAELLQKSAS